VAILERGPKEGFWGAERSHRKYEISGRQHTGICKSFKIFFHFVKLSEIFPKDWKDWEDTRGNLVEQHGWYTSLGWQFIVILTPEREDALST